MRNANVRGATLQGATLSGADLRVWADMTAADLRGADLEHTNLTMLGPILTGAAYNAETKWPLGFHPQNRGAVPAAEEGESDEPK